jgi:hypothetical protein
VCGYLVLSTTSNQGTAFALPWLPALILLAVAAAASLPWRPLRLGLAAVVAAVSVYDLAIKSGIDGLSEPASADVPVLDRVTVLDGRDVIYRELEEYGQAVPSPPPSRLPALHREWGSFARRAIRIATAATGGNPRVLVGTGDWVLSSTRLQLASELEYHRRIWVEPARLGGPDSVEFYRRRLAESRVNVVLVSDPPRVRLNGVTRSRLEAAARQLGFRQIARLRVPDGRRAALWWRPAT